MRPAPCTLHPAPCTLHPAPCKAPCTVQPAGYWVSSERPPLATRTASVPLPWSHAPGAQPLGVGLQGFGWRTQKERTYWVSSLAALDLHSSQKERTQTRCPHSHTRGRARRRRCGVRSGRRSLIATWEAAPSPPSSDTCFDVSDLAEARLAGDGLARPAFTPMSSTPRLTLLPSSPPLLLRLGRVTPCPPSGRAACFAVLPAGLVLNSGASSWGPELDAQLPSPTRREAGWWRLIQKQV